jgi:hypothetical protein
MLVKTVTCKVKQRYTLLQWFIVSGFIFSNRIGCKRIVHVQTELNYYTMGLFGLTYLNLSPDIIFVQLFVRTHKNYHIAHELFSAFFH